MCTHSIDDLLPHAPLHCAATGEMVKGSLLYTTGLHTGFFLGRGAGEISRMTYFVRVYMRHCHAYKSHNNAVITNNVFLLRTYVCNHIICAVYLILYSYGILGIPMCPLPPLYATNVISDSPSLHTMQYLHVLTTLAESS